MVLYMSVCSLTLRFLDHPLNLGQTFAYAFGVGCKSCYGGLGADWVGTAGSGCWDRYCYNDRAVDAGDVGDNGYKAGFGCCVAGKRPVGGEAASGSQIAKTQCLGIAGCC